MRTRHTLLTRTSIPALCGALLFSGLPISIRADIDPHAAQDAFDAEVAAMLPETDIVSAAATLPAERSTLGEWGAVISWTPHIPVSAATLPDGRILTFASNQRTTFPSGPEFTYAATWNPATGQFVEYNHPSHDMFCGALVMLPDGRVLVNGGRNTTVRSSIFDWRVNTWTRTPDMNDPRWYNTSVALPNGRVWTVSGSGGSGTAERWDEAIGWSRLTGINWNTVLAEPGYINIWHPLLSLAPDGRLIHFGPTDTMHWVSTDGSGAMSNTDTVVPGSHYPKEGCWVMYDEGRILVAGGGANTTANASDTTTGTSSTLAYTVDVRTGTPIVTPRNPMTFARQFANCVVLPNGEVMVMGGNTSGLKFTDTGSILTPEIWNPATGQWRSMANADVPRNYHSLALLLPDGRVMSGGGGLGGGDHRDAQLFTPPNLFNADGAQLLATRFVTPRLPSEETASVQTTVGNVKYGGEVLAINTATFGIEGTTILEHSEQPDTSNSAKGIPNYLGAAAISPDGQSAWVPSKQDNIKRGTLRNGGVLTHDMSVRSIASRIDLANGVEDIAGRIDFDNAGIASASAFDPNGNFLFTALEGSREIAVSDTWARQEILRFDAGRAPQGLALSSDGRTLFVHNFMDRSVTVHDLNALANGATVPPLAPVTLNCVATEKLSSTVLLGKQLFYDTRDNRVAFQQYVSCAGCHNDGGQDGRVWDFTQFGEGLRNTITLRGHGGVAQGPLHWTGNFDEVQDFEGQIRNFALGTGLMSDADFHAGTRSQPLGDAKAGLSTDLDALAAYVSSLTKQGDSPDRNPDGSMTSAALAGKTVFQQQNCVQCHSGSQFTDSALDVLHDVGTLKPASGQRLGAALSGLDTPTLLGLWATAPYLHDGSAATLEAAVSAHDGVTLSAAEMSDLIAFLRQLDDAGTAPVPAMISWTAPAAITYGTALSGAQLNATANVPGTFAYNPPVGSVLNAGAGQILSVTFTPDDVFVYGPATTTVMIGVLRAPLTITAQNQGKVYGAVMPTFTAAYAGFVNGDSASALDTPVSLNTVATPGSPVGNYTITANGAADANYTMTHTNGTLNVTPALLTIAADNKIKNYGAANPPLTASYAGFVNGDTAANLDTPVSLTTSATAGSGVGSYPITASSAADLNYTIAFAAGTLTVNPASLTIRADDKTKVVGAANPPLTITYTGFVNGDTASALDAAVTLATTAMDASPEGTYPITASGAVDANYNITHVNGTMTVTPATALPVPWQHQDVGAVGLTGDATHTAGAFTVSGSGTDIWNNADGFHFVYQPWTGNGEIIARVGSVGNTDPWAKAGVMFRESLTAGSRHAMLVITPGNGSAFQRRVATDGVSTHTAGPVVAAPYWVRLVRNGNILQGYVSTDGTVWTSVGSDTVAMANQIYVGLAVTAHNNTALSTATFNGVQTAVPVLPPTIAITSPANGTILTNPASIAIAASVTANGAVISKVEFFRSGALLGEDVTSPYAFTWTGAVAGTHALTARVIYGAGSAVTSSPVNITVASAPVAPTGLTATASSSSQINLAWTATSANHTGFRIERSINGTTFTQLATVGASARTYANTGLNPGSTYYYRVCATNAYGSSPNSSVASATTPAFAVKINFQPAASAVPSGYLPDGGSAYGSRGNGHSYGWSSSNTSNTRDRNSSRSPDQRYDTLNHMQLGGSRTWEIAVPNGTYNVFVVAGDANAYDSVFRVNVEGVLTISGTPDSSTRWLSGTKTVTVSDGRLTISNGSGASNNKICFIDITSAATQARVADDSVTVVDAPIILQGMERDLKGRVTLQVNGTAGASYSIEASSDLKTWEPVAVATDLDGTLAFDDPAGEKRSQRFYRVRLNQ